MFNPHLQERQTLFSRSSKGCYYPEMALFSSLSLPFFVFSVKRGLEKLEANLTPEEIPLQNNRNGDEEPTDYLSGQRESYQTLKGIYSLRWLCWGIVVLSFVWQIVAISNSISGSSRGYKFVIDCVKKPESVINCQESNSSSFPYRCFISDSNIWIWNFLLGLSGLSATLIAAYLSALPTVFPSLRSPRSLKFIKVLLLFWVYIVPWLVVAFYTAMVGINQAGANWDAPRSGMSVEALATSYGCDIDLSLLASKTGYLKEWAEQKWTSVDEGFGGIARKISLV